MSHKSVRNRVRVRVRVVRLVDEKEEADLWIVNSCTVKGPSQSGMSNVVQTGRRLGKKIVVTGCVPQGDKKNAEIEDLSVIGMET